MGQSIFFKVDTLCYQGAEVLVYDRTLVYDIFVAHHYAVHLGVRYLCHTPLSYTFVAYLSYGVHHMTGMQQMCKTKVYNKRVQQRYHTPRCTA